MDKEYKRIITKYPDKTPIIVKKANNSTINTIDKSKYLVPGNLTISQFAFIIRKRIKITPETAIFILINDSTLPPSNALIEDLYNSYKNEDGFLYITYTNENTFG
tara:strand:- start:92 stop:406 length:315 start_codon:yes stop_codon:yes gene_type:complete